MAFCAYRWAIVSGQVPGVVMDAASGNLTGTPSTVGSYGVTVQAIDSAGERASKSFILLVNTPSLTLMTASLLPAGNVGAAYSQRFSVTVGTPPYLWSVPAGWTPGPEVGTFTLVVQVSEAAGLQASRSFTVTIGAAALAITTDPQLAAGTIGREYSAAVAATGGVPPYDDRVRATSLALFRVSFDMPPLPGLTILGLPATPDPASQRGIRVEMDAPFPVALTGQLLLSLVPEGGGGDESIQFIGSQFTFTQPFTTQGDSNAVVPVSVTLTNRFGQASGNVAR